MQYEWEKDYVKLQEGEIIKDGDEYWSNCIDGWLPVFVTQGNRVGSIHCGTTYRRKRAAGS